MDLLSKRVIGKDVPVIKQLNTSIQRSPEVTLSLDEAFVQLRKAQEAEARAESICMYWENVIEHWADYDLA